jgi:hypothetical protein
MPSEPRGFLGNMFGKAPKVVSIDDMNQAIAMRGAAAK